MNILIVSFDLQKPEHPVRNLAMGNILSAWRSTAPDASIEHESINILDPAFDLITRVQELFKTREINRQDYIAFAVAIWSEQYVKQAIDILYRLDFKGQIILGGYQITGKNRATLEKDYPMVQHFVRGFGETALEQILDDTSDTTSTQSIHSYNMFDRFPDPYRDGSIQLEDSVRTVNIETKRGCPYACSYCAHDTVQQRRVIEKPVSDAIDELAFLEAYQLEKINILDPVFNTGKSFLEIAQWKSQSTAKSTNYSVQYKLRKNMHHFLNYCSSGKIHLEIGIQSLDRNVLRNIDRDEDPAQTLEQLKEVTDFTTCEVSIIYGLPGQTLKSFEDTIQMLQGVGGIAIKAFPLMILPGTRLFYQKEYWKISEEMDQLSIPYVIKSSSFTELEWKQMQQIATSL
jgi:radical SAM superfamily enzyme YgiQ (UPF0313 family)